jgi:hypothetical protein
MNRPGGPEKIRTRKHYAPFSLLLSAVTEPKQRSAESQAVRPAGGIGCPHSVKYSKLKAATIQAIDFEQDALESF